MLLFGNSSKKLYHEDQCQKVDNRSVSHSLYHPARWTDSLVQALRWAISLRKRAVKPRTACDESDTLH